MWRADWDISPPVDVVVLFGPTLSVNTYQYSILWGGVQAQISDLSSFLKSDREI